MIRHLLTASIVLLTVTACINDSSTSTDVDSTFLEQGTLAPDFNIYTAQVPDGFTLHDLVGRYVMIEFWASWCPDCRGVTADVKAMYDTYANDNLIFVGFAFDTDEDTWQTYITENDLSWVQTCEFKEWKESDVATAYNVLWIPTFYLIDPSGRVAYATIEVSAMAARLQEMNITED